MNQLTRIMSYDKTKNENQENCNCTECASVKNVESKNQILEYSKLSEEEIEQIISERYSDKDDKTKTFIKKALRVHGDRYDYSNVVYVKAKEYVEIICRVEGHDNFLQTPDGHLQKRGCPNCNKYHKLNKETFILKCKKKFGTKLFDYSKFIYIDSVTKSIVICKRCNLPFIITPSIHLFGQGCPRCDGNERLTTESYINRAKRIKDNNIRFDYSKTVYTNTQTKITIICKKCNKSFLQLPFNHLKYSYCPYCDNRNTQWNTKSFIDESNKIFNYRYDYSETNYINMDTKVIIICPVHGKFEQLPSSHLRGVKCKFCSIDERNKIFNNTLKERLDDFINRSKSKYGDLYDYSLVYKNYKNQRSKVNIICNKCHKSFFTTCDNFLRNHGCPHCNKSIGENIITIWLKQHNIEFKSQKTFEGCLYKNKLKFDFYIPSKNMCIEYDGIGHFQEVNWNSKLTKEQMRNNLKEYRIRDNIKNEFCKNNGINLIRINYKQNIIERLCKIFLNN